MYDFRTPEYQRYTEAHLLKVEQFCATGAVSADLELQASVALETAQAAAEQYPAY